MFFAEHFTMSDVAVYGAHCVGKVQEGMPDKRAIVCMDAKKREIILDSSRVYSKGSPLYVSEDRTPKQLDEIFNTFTIFFPHICYDE